MRNRLLLKLVTCSLLMVFPGASLPAETSAMVRATGPVSINRHAVPQSSALFPSDQLETAGEGSATVTSNGTSTLVAPRTRMHALENGLDLECGQVLVNTLAGYVVKLHGWTIRPADGSKAKFDVLQADRIMRVTAIEGTVSLSNGETSTLIAPGHSFDQANTGRCGCSQVFWQSVGGSPVNIRGISVRSAGDQPARFEVWQHEDGVRVTAIEGAVQVSDSQGSQVLQAGQFLDRTRSGLCAVPPGRDTTIAVTTAVGSGILVWLLIRRHNVTPSVP